LQSEDSLKALREAFATSNSTAIDAMNPRAVSTV